VNVTLRLRGLEQERVIKHNGTPIPNGYVNTYWNNVAKPSSPISTNDNTFIRFLSGYQAGTTLSLPPVNGHRLYLEQYITIDGLGANRTTQMFYVMLYIDDNARLVMLDGSKITNFHNSSSSSSTQRAIEFKAGGNQPLLNTNPDLASQFTYATFYWYGGSITNNYNAASITHANIGGQRYLSPVIMGAPNMVGEYRGDRYTKKVFFKYGGSFTGNSGGASPGTVPIHYINFGSNNGSAAARILEIDDGGPYEGLVLF
jgi:hypothetical protein